ncbi:MAG: TolC family protein [Pseudomonadota bacterium]
MTLRRFLAGILALGLHWAAASHAADQPALDLPEAIRQALAQNPRQASQRLDVRKAELEQRAARGARLPAVDFSASATYYGYPTFVVPIRQVPQPPNFAFPPLDRSIYDLGVTLRLPLYTGGRLQQGVVIADLGRNIAVERERLGTQALTYNVSSVYLKILQLSALDRAYAARIDSLQAQARRVHLLVQEGKAPRLDLLRVRVQVRKAEHDRLQIENRRQEAVTLLYSLMGSATLPDAVRLVAYGAAPVPDRRLAELRAEASARRAELQIAEEEMAVARARERLARGERLPSLSLLGAYRERSGADLTFFDDWNIGAQLSVPVFDGGVRRYRVAQAELARQQALEGLRQARLDVDKELQDAWNAVGEAASRLRVAGASVGEAAETLKIERLKYDEGVGLITDLLSAESALLTAEADRLQAEFDLIVARLNLLRASGQLTPAQVEALVVARGADTGEAIP